MPTKSAVAEIRRVIPYHTILSERSVVCGLRDCIKKINPGGVDGLIALTPLEVLVLLLLLVLASR
jgi:hypothetical protein